MKWILASSSPRRKELLAQIGISFTVQPAKGEEKITKSDPAEVVMALSRQKAEEVAASLPAPASGSCLILGADTVVAQEGRIMGKPKDKEDAFRMLKSIAGTCHQVYTGVTMLCIGENPRCITFAEKTDVFLYPISDAEIWAYIESGDPMDKAGAYGIQGAFAAHVKGIAGDYQNVVGLPIGRVYQEWKKLQEER